MLRLSACLRLLGLTVLAAYFLVAALVLLLRYAVLPNIDYWRTDIEEQLSSRLQMAVSISQVSARLEGFNPQVRFKGVTLTDREGEPVLHLPGARASINWRALLQGRLQFADLDIRGLELLLRQDAQQRLWVAGHSFDLDTDAASELSLDDPAIQWLAEQGQLTFSNATLIWQDERRNAQPLRLAGVNLLFRTDPDGVDLALEGKTRVGEGEGFRLQGRFDQVDRNLPRTDPRAWDGLLYIALDDLAPDGWRPWLDVPSRLVSGEVSGQWWLSWKQGASDRFAFQAEAHNVKWDLFDDNLGQAKKGQLQLVGAWNDLEQLLDGLALRQPSAGVVAPDSKKANAHGMQVHLLLEGSRLQLAPVFAQPLDIDLLQLDGALAYNDASGWQVQVRQATLNNNDFQLGLQGSWREAPDMLAGYADFTGVFKRALLPAIGRYMPESVDKHARDWLQQSLLAGELEDTKLLLRGDLAQFPFGEHPESGDFHVYGRYRDAVIDYAPATNGEPGWPRLTAMHGQASLRRSDLRIQADQVTVWPVQSQSIVLNDTQARIANIEHQAVLEVRTGSKASAPAYLALVRETPLRSMLDGLLDDTRATGEWSVPLKLRVPLTDVNQTRAEGAVNFSDGGVQLSPGWPALERVTGKLSFNEEGVWTPGLQLALLGGDGQLRGGIGRPDERLRLEGQLTAKGLANFVAVPAMDRLSGRTDYLFELEAASNGGVNALFQSALQGLAIDFVPPFGKEATSSIPLSVAWHSDKQHNATLALALGEEFEGVLQHRKPARSSSYFDQMSIGVGIAAPPLQAGGRMDIRQKFIDLDKWSEQLSELSSDFPTTSGVGPQSLFPELDTIRVQAEQAVAYDQVLDKAVLTTKRTGEDQWRFDVSSTQSAGNVLLQGFENGGAGRVKARFERLELGEKYPRESTSDAFTDLPEGTDIPAIDLDVGQLSLYGRSIGHLVLQGDGVPGQQAWKLSKLLLEGDGATLDGAGTWHLAGPRRGLSLDARMTVSDAGRYLNQLGLQEVMKGGKGFLEGNFDWRNFPSGFSRSDLDGNLRIELEKGRFVAMNSRTARLLELLSWQSLLRMARFDIGQANPFREGLPFDRISGDLHVKQGLLNTNNLHLAGPAANISLGGDVNLVNGVLDLQAMVVPNFEMSGASLAAGLAINPIVGVGAFLTQWALRGPLSRAMAVHYTVKGDWDEPRLLDEAGTVVAGATKEQLTDASATPPDALTAPADTSATPPDAVTAPADGLAAPADALATPADGLAAPADALATPPDALTVPADALTVPADALAIPLDTLTAPADPEGKPKHHKLDSFATGR